MRAGGGGGGGGAEGRGCALARALIGHCLQRPELRDELYCQLVRMTTNNPASDDQLCRLWTLFCLCAVSFSPSRTLRKVQPFPVCYSGR